MINYGVYLNYRHLAKQINKMKAWCQDTFSNLIWDRNVWLVTEMKYSYNKATAIQGILYNRYLVNTVTHLLPVCIKKLPLNTHFKKIRNAHQGKIFFDNAWQCIFSKPDWKHCCKLLLSAKHLNHSSALQLLGTQVY